MTSDEIDPWSVLESEMEYDNPWYSGGYDRVKQPDGTEKDYFWASLPDAVVVVARIDDQLVFVDQYRPVIRRQCLELPAGLVEDGEDYTEAAERELREETGFKAGELTLMEDYWCTTGLLRHRRAMVFAERLTPVGARRESNEFLTVERIPVERALSVARETPANDATLEGILLAKQDGHLDPEW